MLTARKSTSEKKNEKRENGVGVRRGGRVVMVLC